MRFVSMIMALWGVCCGGCSYKDLTQRPEVQASGIVGRCFVSKKPLTVVENQWLHMKELTTIEHGEHLGPIIGEFPSGTRVRIVRVERHYDGAKPSLFPTLMRQRTMPLGLVENGTFAGQKLGTDMAGLRAEHDGVSASFWEGCK
jgi:hypothetical protein